MLVSHFIDVCTNEVSSISKFDLRFILSDMLNIYANKFNDASCVTLHYTSYRCRRFF